MELSQQEVHRLLDYDAATGELRWKYIENPTSRADKVRNSRFAGRIAGTPHRSSGGITIRIDGVAHLAHRLIWLIMTGELPECVNHRNGDQSDNRWSNLRQATQSEVISNGSGWSSRTSEYRGVYFRGWEAKVMKDGVGHRCGVFFSEEKAARAYDAKARELNGEFARLNFPDDPGDQP